MKSKFKVKRSDLVWFAIFTVFLFQNALSMKIAAIKYTDELVTLFFAAYTVVYTISKKTLDKTYIIMYLLIGCLAIIGLIGTFTAGLHRTAFMIVLDLMYLFRVFVCFIGAVVYFGNRKRQGNIVRMLAAETRIIVWIAFGCMILSYFGNIGMTRGQRYGIKCFQFIYSNPGVFSQYCIIFLLILTADLGVSRNTVWRKISLCALVITWLSTCRSRAFVIVFIWLFICLVSSRDRISQKVGNNRIIKQLFKPRNIIIVGLATLLIASSAVTRYFGDEVVSARNLLLRGGLRIMMDYFPFGAGFASFGTEPAATYYSPLYGKYGLSSFWALAKGGSELTDCYWPAICGELGIIGLVLMAVLIFLFLKNYLKLSSSNKYFTISAITYIVYLLISSTATGAFASYITAEFIVILVAIAYSKGKKVSVT